jgi:hypothetical protein
MYAGTQRSTITPTRDQALLQRFLGVLKRLRIGDVDDACSSMDSDSVLDLGHGVSARATPGF